MSRIHGQHLLWVPFRPLADRFGREFFRAVPEKPGVYLMCGDDEGVLYVGKARNLRRRLASHRSTSTESIPRKQRRLLQSVRRIYWDECPDETAAEWRERELIVLLKPRFNTVGVRPAVPRTLVWRVRNETLELALEPANETADPCVTLREAVQPGECRVGPFAGIRLFHAVLLRLMWWQAHPEAASHALPAALRGDRPPDRWEFTWPVGGALELKRHLAGFFDGDPAGLLQWVSRSMIPEEGGSRFRQRWQERDLEWLTEFAERFRQELRPTGEPHSPLQHFNPSTFRFFTSATAEKGCR